MTQRLLLALTVLFILVITSFAVAEAELIAHFPESLEFVGEEAFAGTAIKTAVFDDNLMEINERAFSGNSFLQFVFLPPSVRIIANDAFWGTNDLIFAGVELSRAHVWAIKNNYSFVKWNLWNWVNVRNDSTVIIFYCLFLAFWIKEINPTVYPMSRLRSMRPQDRAELHPVEFRFP